MAFQIDHKEAVLVLTFEGDVEGIDIAQGVHAAAQVGTADWIVDLTQVRTLGISPPDMKKLGENRGKVAGAIPPGRTVLLMRPKDVEIGTLYSVVAARDPVSKHRTLRVFIEQDEAWAWLRDGTASDSDSAS